MMIASASSEEIFFFAAPRGHRADLADDAIEAEASVMVTREGFGLLPLHRRGRRMSAAPHG